MLKPRSHFLFAAFLVITSLSTDALAAVTYDIVYVRQPRFGDNANTTWPEVFHPARLDPGADLMLLHTNGTEEVLVTGGNGSVTDPFISFDGQWCYYAYFPDLRQNSLSYQRGDLPYAGCDIYKIHLSTRQVTRLTFQEFTPNTGAGKWNYANPSSTGWQTTGLGYGLLNLGPCPVPGGKIAFTSNRNAYTPPKGYTNPTLQLFVMDEDGENVTFIAPINIGSALHPTPLQDGRLMFSSYESQGLRDQRMWGIWSIWPDGRLWQPVVSAFHSGQAFHFMTQISNGDIVVEDYYNLNNNGFGALYRLPPHAPAGQPQFYNAFGTGAPGLDQTIGDLNPFKYPFTIPFQPRGMYALTPFTHPQDEAAPTNRAFGKRVGKFTHPSGAPNNDLLVVWTPGPANDLNRPTTLPEYDAGLYLITNTITLTNPSQLVLIKNNPNYNEAWPRAVVPWKAVHGTDEPVKLPWLPNDGTAHPDLPPGTPYGIVGTSSFYKRESFPGVVPPWANFFNGLDAFNTSENGQSSNWEYQGSDAGRYWNSNIYAVRILAMEPNSHRSYGPNSGGPYNDGNHYVSHARERLRILGEIPLRKADTNGAPILDGEGNPDTSFMAKIPSDTPFTFQMLDADGLVLTMAQTWHHVRPGEVRNNCGGCHAHSQQPLAIENTAAGKPGYQPFDLTAMLTLLSKDTNGAPVLKTNPPGVVNVEFLRDIRPVLQRSCIPCHVTTNDGNLVLNDYTNYSGLPGDYARLADDTDARWGYKPVISNQSWRQSNASRYIRMFQSRRSLLIWKIFGRRLDGWTNTDHPTESTNGVASSLPPGADPNAADLDYTGDMMPPPGSVVPALSEDEKIMFARWVDLGCPINTGTGDDANYGWFLDELRPTITVSSPRPNRNFTPLTELRIGVADAYTGVSNATLSIKADFAVNGTPVGSELKGQGSFIAPGIFSIPLQAPLANLSTQHVTAAVADVQGNTNKAVVRFWVDTSFRVLSLDASALNTRRLTLRLENPSGHANYTVLCSENLAAPVISWTPATIANAADEPNQIRRLDVDLPVSITGLCFLSVRRD